VLVALRSVAAGHTYVSPAIVTRMVDAYVRRSPDAPADDPYETLTPREREVLLLAAMGHTSRDIARSLHLSEQTVHSHRASAMEKLGLHDRVELLRYSVRRGILSAATL
jgi:two-component system response regulator NreC